MFAKHVAAALLGALAALAPLPSLSDENDGRVRAPASTLPGAEDAAPSTAVEFFAITVALDGTRDPSGGRIGGVNSSRLGLGAYEVAFTGRRNLHRRCHYTASIVSRDEGTTEPGVAVINSRGLTNDALFVTTTTLDGTRTDLPFAILVMCSAPR